MDYIKLIAEHLLEPLLVVLAGVAIALARAGKRWLNRRLGTEEVTRELQLDALLVRLTDMAVAYAEQRGRVYARDRGALPASAAKLEWALDFLSREMAERKLPQKARDHLVDLIEARLGTPEAPGTADRATDAVLRLQAGASKATALLVVLMVTLPSVGCGAQRYRTHLTAAQTSREVIQQGGEVLEGTCTPEALVSIEQAEGPADALRFGERCEAAREAQHLSVSLWTDWVVAAAAEGLDAPTMLRAAAALLDTWRELSELVGALGGDLPTLDLGGAS